MAARIQVEGGRELRRALRQTETGIADLKEVNQQVGELVARTARTQTVPRISGTLAGSVRSARQAAGAVVRAGRARVPYAGPIHFGWEKRGIRPQPFLYEAADRRAGEVFEAYERGVAKVIADNRLD